MFIRRFDTRNFRFAIAITVLVALASCTDDAPGMEEETSSETGTETETETETETGDEMMLAIVGSYTDDFGDMHTISETEWTNSAGSFAIAQYDNDEMWLVAQNAETNMFSPGLWSRFDWAWDGEQLYYCQSVFDGATIEAALAGSANADDLTMGCGGFPWSQLTPQ
jgi:hypothetical protein